MFGLSLFVLCQEEMTSPRTNPHKRMGHWNELFAPFCDTLELRNNCTSVTLFILRSLNALQLQGMLYGHGNTIQNCFQRRSIKSLVWCQRMPIIEVISDKFMIGLCFKVVVLILGRIGR